MILALISRIGVAGGTGYVLEYKGPAIRSLDMEARMTICNMSIEAGARAGLVAPDDTTFQYVSGREFAPKGEDWDRALERWQALRGDPEASYDQVVTIDASGIDPMISFGDEPIHVRADRRPCARSGNV